MITTRPCLALLPAILLFSAALHAQPNSSDPPTGGSGFETLLLSGLRHDPRGQAVALAYRADTAKAREAEAERLLSADSSFSYAYRLPDSGNDGSLDPADATGTASASVGAAALGPLGSSLGAGLSYSLSHDRENGADSLNAELSFSLPVLVNGKLADPRLSRAAARLAVTSPIESAADAEKSDRCAFVASLARQILAFADSSRRASIAGKAADIAQRDLAIARVKHDSGLIPFKDLQEAEMEAESWRLEAIAAGAAFGNQTRKMSARTGLPGPEIAALEVSCPRPNLALDVGGGELLSLSAARRGLLDAEAARILSGAESAPRLSLSGDYSMELRNSYPGPDRENARGPLSLRAGLSLDLGFAAAARRREAADARARASALAYESAKADAEAQASDATERIEAASAQAAYLETRVESARARLVEFEAAARAGTAIGLDAERAALALERSLSELEATRGELLLALIDLYSLRGMDATALLGNASAANAR